MKIERNIWLLIVFHLAVLATPYVAKIAHHQHANIYHSGADGSCFHNATEKCLVCEFEYLPYLKNDLAVLDSIAPPAQTNLTFYRPIFIREYYQLSLLRAPPPA